MVLLYDANLVQLFKAVCNPLPAEKVSEILMLWNKDDEERENWWLRMQFTLNEIL